MLRVGQIFLQKGVEHALVYVVAARGAAGLTAVVELVVREDFDSVVDPSGGSYYIETLTNSIADEAWKLFREVEDKGGYIAAFRDGFITSTIEASAAAKDKAVATRRTVLLGANQYPNFTEVADKAISESAFESGKFPSCGGVAAGTADGVVGHPH